MNKNYSFLRRPLEYDDAFITSYSRYGESDCVVKLFTRRSGRISLFFKRGLDPKNHSALVTLSFARIGFLASDYRMGKLYSLDADPQFLLLASSLKIFAYSSYLAELIEKLIPEHEALEPIFNLISEAYNSLLHKGPQSSMLRALELKLLANLGYLPEFPEAKTNYFYEPLSGYFMTNLSNTSFEVSEGALKIAHSMLEENLYSNFHAQKSELMMIGRIFHSRLKVLGLWPLKSLTFFKQIK